MTVMGKILPLRCLTAIAVTSILLLSGCKQNVDLDAIKTLASATDAASSSYAVLAQDFYDSCVRTYEWNWAAARTYQGFPTLSLTCGANQRAAAQWQQANQVLVAYISALGALAGGNTSETDYGIPGLIDAFNASGATALSPDQSKAISSAASGLITDLFNIRRRTQISKFAPQANDDLASLVSALQTVAKSNYSTQLDRELDAVNHFYQPVAPNPMAGPLAPQRSAKAKPTSPTLSPQVTRAFEDFGRVEILSLRDTYRQDRAAVDSRRVAIGAYERSLSSIASAHAALVNAIQTNDSSHVAGIIESYVSQLRPDIQTISKAFAGGK